MTLDKLIEVAKDESNGRSRVVRPLQSICRRISASLFAPVVRGVRGEKKESRSEIRLPGLGQMSSGVSRASVQDSPPLSPRSRRERKQAVCGSPFTGLASGTSMKRRKEQSVFAKTFRVRMLGQGGVGKSGNN